MEQYYYDRHLPEPLFPKETLLQRAEDYLKAKHDYRTALAEYSSAAGDDRSTYAHAMQTLYARMQMLRNTYVLTIGGLHGQEMNGQEVLYDPAIHGSSIIHGDIGPGDPIRFLNSAICASDNTVLIPAQAIRVY